MPRVVPFLLLCLLAAACGQNRYEPKAEPLSPDLYRIDASDRPGPGEHLRYAEPGRRGGGLDLAVTEYTHPDGGARVVLFGVVHVADAFYYDAVQRALDGYDTVLYEGVKPEDLTGKEWQDEFLESGGEAASLQKELAGWFGFEFQLDAIDYGRPNFVHADMSAEEFRAAGGDKYLPELGGDGDDAPGAVPTEVRSTWDAVKAFGELALGEDGPLRSLARRMFAETMGRADIGTSLDMFPGLSELILVRRNEVVIEKLEEVLPTEAGTIAIFYGAAHMPDLEDRLTKELGYRRDGARWLRAWAVRPPLR